MELRVLRYFLAVAREQSISKAAEAVHVTQPTLSRQIMDLEDELGAQLFVRSRYNKSVSLTDDGLRLFNHAKEIVELADKTEHEFKEKDDLVEGDIYIGAGETDSMRLVAKVANELKEKHPNLRYHFFSGHAETVRDRLEKGLIDFGIFIGVTGMDRYNYMNLQGADRWGILMRKDNPLASKKGIKPEDLIDVPLFISSQSYASNEIAGWFGPVYDKLRIIGTYNLAYNVSIMVDEGLGCVITLEKLISSAEGTNFAFVPLVPELHVGWTLAWRRSARFSKAAQLFLDTLRKVNENPRRK